MSNPILKIKRGSGAPISLETGELAMDLLNKSLFIGTDTGVLAIGGEHVFAKKSYVDSAVSTEQAAREAADTTLTTNLNAEITRATAAEGVNAAAITAEETARIAAVSAEQTARIAGDSALDAKITTEKGRIDAILDASQADKDSFAEIVALINSVDTENDTAFAGYVTSNNAALAQEVSDRQSGDTALGLRIDAEATARATADTSLSNRIAAIETVSPSSRLDAVEADVADHETRITALETAIDGGVY